MSNTKHKSNVTDNTDIHTKTNLTLSTLASSLIHNLTDELINLGETPSVIDPIYPDIEHQQASLLNKYQTYFRHYNNPSEDWHRLQDIHTNFLALRKKFRDEETLTQADLDNLLLDEEQLKFLHKYLSTSLAEPTSSLEIGIDDFEITYTISPRKLEKLFHLLERSSDVQRLPFYDNSNYVQRYGRVEAFTYRTGGTFVIHHKKASSKVGDCLFSFRLSETTFKNISHFFSCLKQAMGTKYSHFTDHATITRVDPYVLIYGVPTCMLLVKEHYKPNGKPLKTKVYPEEFGLLESFYSGDKTKSSHFIIYDVLLKYHKLKRRFLKGKTAKDQQRKFKKLFKREAKLACMSKIERRILTHKNGGKKVHIKDLQSLKGHAFSRLVFYSPLIFLELPLAINKQLLRYGIGEVEKHLTKKQTAKLNTVLSNPLHQLYFDVQDFEQSLRLKLLKLKHCIKQQNVSMNKINLP
jgi:hypothetical protein